MFYCVLCQEFIDADFYLKLVHLDKCVEQHLNTLMETEYQKALLSENYAWADFLSAHFMGVSDNG